MSARLPPNVGILSRGAGAVLGGCAVLSVAIGVALGDRMTALNSVGFLGACVLSSGAAFYSSGLSRSGIPTAGQAARVLVRVLAWSAAAAAVLYLVLLGRSGFRAEASQFGLASVAGIAVVALLGTIGVVLWRGR